MKRDVIEIVVILILSVAIGLSVRVFFIDVVKVQGPSMEDTIQEGDKLVLLKRAKPTYGDIVVVNMGTEKNIIKRVIGLSGDEIWIEDRELYRNGKKIEEPYIKEPMNNDYTRTKIGDDELFLMGDNRNLSADSRLYGAFDMKEYRGKVWLEVFSEWKVY